MMVEIKIVYIFFLIFLIKKSNQNQKTRYPTLIPVPKNWNNNCRFYNRLKLKNLVENNLANKYKTCLKLGLCPEVPNWITHKNVDWYDKVDLESEKDNLNLIPSFRDGKPLHLFYKFHVENLSSMNLKEMTFRIDYFVEQLWFIPKGVCDKYYDIMRSLNIVADQNATEIEIQVNFFKYIWLPDTFIANSLSSVRQMKPVDTRSLQLKTENRNDEVPFCYLSYQTKDAVAILCNFDFHVFPFDKQICSIKIRSFSFDNQSIIMHWEEMDWNQKLQLPGYTVLLRHNTTKMEEWMGEYYSVLYVEIVLERQLLNLLVGVYFSTFLIVLIIVSTFWLNSYLISDRINIGVISILALYDQYNESLKNLPSIGYMHPLAYWIIICMIFVFAQLIQNAIYYFIVLNKKYFMNRRFKSINPFKSNQINDTVKFNEKEDDDSKEFLHAFISVQLEKSNLDYIPMKFDLISRLIFCVFIIFFLAIYWPNSIKLSIFYNILKH